MNGLATYFNKAIKREIQMSVQKTVLSLTCFLALITQADAHFLWVAVHGDDKTEGIRLWFSEGPYPGEAHLLDKVMRAKVHVRQAEKKPIQLALKKAVDEDQGALTAPLELDENCAVEAVYEYGVFDHTPEPVLLTYYAKHILANDRQKLEALIHSPSFTLDMHPALSDEHCTVQITWQGRPNGEATVFVVDPEDDVHEFTSDKNGFITFPIDKEGQYGIRTSFVDSTDQGTQDGKAYAKAMHVSTLTIGLPLAGAPKISAEETLTMARDSRAVWGDGFPGFTCRFQVHIDGKSADGSLHVTSSGDVQVEIDGLAETEWLDRTLQSLVAHRMPSEPIGTGVKFLDEPSSLHPLGPRLKLEGDAMGSVYRIKDHVVTQVNRAAGENRFTINVLDVHRNNEGEYLPRVFTVSSWDGEGNLQSSRTIVQSWIRVDRFDLPDRLLEITSGSDNSVARCIEFRDQRLDSLSTRIDID